MEVQEGRLLLHSILKSNFKTKIPIIYRIHEQEFRYNLPRSPETIRVLCYKYLQSRSRQSCNKHTRRQIQRI